MVIEASHFLNELNIIWNRGVPYPPQVMALASAYAILGHRAEAPAAKDKLAQWFWCVTLGELYGSSTETLIARDVIELEEWSSTGGADHDLLMRRCFIGTGCDRSGFAFQPLIRA